mmetsp:Transcript_12862/g.28396  ORF Transcript_12862/g.28396 Transcript_12862/m.28396 type:complete len:81 (+) Transcript_12862:1728-1970(+)
MQSEEVSPIRHAAFALFPNADVSMVDKFAIQILRMNSDRELGEDNFPRAEEVHGDKPLDLRIGRDAIRKINRAFLRSILK